MGKIIINKQKCKGCSLCIHICPKGLIKTGNNLNKMGIKPAEFKESKDCLGCTMCAIICPECCIEVYK